MVISTMLGIHLKMSEKGIRNSVIVPSKDEDKISSRLLNRTMSLREFLIHVKSQMVGRMCSLKSIVKKLNGDG